MHSELLIRSVWFRFSPRSLPAVSFSGPDGVNAHDLLPGLVGLVGLVGLAGLVGLVGLGGLGGLVGLVGLGGLGGCESAAVPHQSCTSFGY